MGLIPTISHTQTVSPDLQTQIALQNAVNRSAPDPRQAKLLPVVAYAVARRIAQGEPDYWDYATILELAVLGRDEEAALEALDNVLMHVREGWEAESTARNLGLIRSTRAARGEVLDWVGEIEETLMQRGLG